MSQPLANITNTRLSMGPPRKNTIAQPANTSRQSSVGIPRPSLARPGNVRTSSIGSRASSIGTNTRQSSIGARLSRDGRKSMGGPMKDSRSISDKDFQRNAVRNIIQYLAEVGYSKPITPKTVSAPSTKDFLSIVEFLFQRFEGLQTFKIGAKPEEFTNDVMYIFSQIQYPFPLMKSNISTVGAPHAWPAFLAALDWFVTLLKAKDTPNNYESANLSFYEYLCKSYTGFLSGGDDFEVFEEEVADQFATTDNALQTDIDNQRAVKIEVTSEISVFANSPVCEPPYCALAEYYKDRIASLEGKKSALLMDIQKFNTLIERLDSHNLQLTKKLEEAEKDTKKYERELITAREEKVQLEAIVAQQEEQSVDAVKINKERILLEESITSALKFKELAQQRVWDQEMVNHKKGEDISKLIASYDELAQNLLLLGPNNKFANGVDYTLTFNGVSSETQVCTSVKDTVKPGLLQLKEELISKILLAMNEKHSLDATATELEDGTTESRDKMAAEEAKHAKLEAIYQKEKEKYMAELKQVESENELVAKQIDRLNAEAASELGRSHKSIETLALEQQEISRQIEQRNKEEYESVLRLVDTLSKHKEYVHKRLQEGSVRIRNLYSTIDSNN